MTRKLRLLVWALALQILPLHAQEEEDHSNDDIQDPNTPISLTTNFHCINIYKTEPSLNPSQMPIKLCPGDPPFHTYNYDIWLSHGFPHDGPERKSPTQYLRAKWLSHVALSWYSDTALIDERYGLTETSWLDEQRSQTKRVIRRRCNPRKSAELNPYWLDFEKGADRDALTWAGDGGFVEYDKAIRNSVCAGKYDDDDDDDDDDDADGGGAGAGAGGEMYGPFNNMGDGFTKGSKSTMGGGFATTSSSSSLFPVGEPSFGSVDDGTTTPPLISSTSPDEDTGKAIDTSSSSFFFSATPSSASIALQDINNNEDTSRFDSKLFTRRRTRKRAVGTFLRI